MSLKLEHSLNIFHSNTCNIFVRSEKRKILSIVAGLIIFVITLLFLHSETNLFDHHTEECQNIDLCLILQNASFDNHVSVNKMIKFLHLFDFSFIENSVNILASFTHLQSEKPLFKIFILPDLNLNNCILRI
jgi:hypothetical protein